FASEMEANRQATQRNRTYHETLVRELEQFLRSKEPPSEERLYKEVHFEGVRPVIFEHTAWDLALATQALSYLKPDLAFDISKVYPSRTPFRPWKTASSLLRSLWRACRATTREV